MVRKHEVEAVINPAGQHVASNETSILNADHEASRVRGCNFRSNDGDYHWEEANAKTLNHSARHESTESGGEDLYKGSEEVDEATETDSSLATDHINEAAGNERTQGSWGLQASHWDTSDG